MLPSRRSDTALVQVSADRAQRVAGQRAARALADHLRLPRPRRTLVGLVAVGAAATARDLAGVGEFFVLAPNAAALVVTLLPRHRALNPRDQLTLMRREINVAAHRRQLRLRPLTQVDEVLQLARMPMQSIGVIDDHRFPRACLDLIADVCRCKH